MVMNEKDHRAQRRRSC